MEDFICDYVLTLLAMFWGASTWKSYWLNTLLIEKQMDQALKTELFWLLEPCTHITVELWNINTTFLGPAPMIEIKHKRLFPKEGNSHQTLAKTSDVMLCAGMELTPRSSESCITSTPSTSLPVPQHWQRSNELFYTPLCWQYRQTAHQGNLKLAGVNILGKKQSQINVISITPTVSATEATLIGLQHF